MGEQALTTDYYEPDVSNLVTENDTPVDNLFSEKEQRLLTSSLYSSWQGRTFLSSSNVGIFHSTEAPPIVPDVFVSLNVQPPENWWEKRNRSYFVWKFGKPPELVVEIVSNREGEELGDKLNIYAQIRVIFYIVHDQIRQLSDSPLRVFELRGMRYFEISENWLEQVDLGVTLWEGEFEGRQDTWLRWCDRQGNILPTGDERNWQAEQRATEAEHRASEAERRAQLLAEQLRNLGINPDTIS
jgi:Uma2 family endonuclease